MSVEHLTYPLWLQTAHWLNVLFLSLLARSGVEILSAHPKLYWNDDCRLGSEWLAIRPRPYPADALFTADDQEQDWPSLIALPGHRHWDLGRHWHFAAVPLWILTGAAYVALLFGTGEWRRLVPTSWDVLPGAWHTLVAYLHFRVPDPAGTNNPLQQLTYFAVVFGLAPLSIATGAAMSPAVAARFPGYIRLFGGRQAARSLHFLSLLAFTAFSIVHVAMVAVHGLGRELALMVLGQIREPDLGRALALGGALLGGIVLVHVAATRFTLRRPDLVQDAAERFVDPIRRAALGRLKSIQAYDPGRISPYLWVNGRPPAEPDWLALAEGGFQDYVLEVGGLVERPLRLSLADLRALPARTQVTLHVCIQGWSGFAAWTGVGLDTLMALCRPLPQARDVVFRAFDDKGRSEPHPKASGLYYGTIPMDMARHPQTLLAYDLNGAPLPREHGAPLRLRLETQYGFTMVKYIRAIDFVASYRQVGKGRGGWPEDNLYRSREASL